MKKRAHYPIYWDAKKSAYDPKETRYEDNWGVCNQKKDFIEPRKFENEEKEAKGQEK